MGNQSGRQDASDSLPAQVLSEATESFCGKEAI